MCSLVWKLFVAYWFHFLAGVRQGGILSPLLFAVYTDVLIMRLGCKLFDTFYGCLLYADAILLLAHSVNGMQQIIEICDKFALELDMKFNIAKSVAIRIGSRYNIQCSPLIHYQESVVSMYQRLNTLESILFLLRVLNCLLII